MRTTLFLLSSLLFLSSCSWPVVSYRWADWLIKKRIVEVVKFYSPQQDALEEEIDKYLVWHQEHMIPEYQDFLGRVKKSPLSDKNQKADSQEMAKEVARFAKEARTLLKRTTLPLAERVSPLLAQLNEEQVERTNTLLLRKIDENKEKLKWNHQKLREATLKKWRDNIINWLGSLNSDQEKTLEREIDGVLYAPKIAYAHSIKSLSNFMTIFHEIPVKDKEGRVKALKEYFAQRNKRSDSKGNSRESWRIKASHLVAKILHQANAKQQKYLLKEIDYWLEILGDIKAI